MRDRKRQGPPALVTPEAPEKSETNSTEIERETPASSEGGIGLDFDFAEPTPQPAPVVPTKSAANSPVRSVEHESFETSEPLEIVRDPAPVRAIVQTPVGRSAPHSLEAEEYLLSCCLLDGPDVVSRCIEARIGSASFYDHKHGIVFARILDLYNRSAPIDVSVVAEELKASKQLDAVGGYPFLTQVSSRIPTTAQAGYFIEKVREQALLREIIRSATSIVEDCYGFSGGIEEFVSDALAKIDAATSAGTHQGWNIVSAERLCTSTLAAPPEIIKGLLYEGGTMMLSGPSKAHKTYTMFAAGAAVASGQQWLGFETTKSPVLYLNLELQDFAAKMRLAAICEALGITPPSLLHLANLRGEMVDLTRLSLRVNAALKKTAAKLVVIDPHYKVSSASGVEENSNDAQAAFLYAIETLCAKHGAAVMLAHHFAKGNASMKNAIDRAAGGGALARWPDVVMTLTEHEESECMTAEFALRNFAPITPFVVRWKHPVWQRDSSLEPARLKQQGGAPEKHSAEDALKKLGDEILTNAEWRKRTDLSDGTFRRKRDALVAAGKVKYESGTYRAAATEPGEATKVSSVSGGLNPADFLPALAAQFKGLEKRKDARPLKSVADGVKGSLGTKEWRQLLAACLAQGVLNQAPDGRYYVP